jgi:putative hemolysin
MQTFHINQNSTLPYLIVALIDDGRYDFGRFNECIQDATITFDMSRLDNGNVRVAKATCEIRRISDKTCNENYCIVYKWKERDTREKGAYIGVFTINFHGNITNGDGVEYPVGKLITPIKEKIVINID